MCFSATASFGAAIALGAVGVVSVSNIKTPAQIPFAVIPLLFGLHQASEGLVWLGLEAHAGKAWVDVSVYVYLLFAQVIWPVWVPYSILALEKNPFRQKLLRVLLVMGTMAGVYLLYCLMVYDVDAGIGSGHIEYALHFPEAGVRPTSIFYFIAIIFPPFISGYKGMNYLGLLLFISYLLSQVFFTDYLISVWCFFAALLSIMVVWILKKMDRSPLYLNVRIDT
jgi:hypothetical protein